MLNSSVNSSAAYSNMKNDLYRIVNGALGDNERKLDEIKNLLIDIRDILQKQKDTNNG